MNMPFLEGIQHPLVLVANGKSQGPGLGCYVDSCCVYAHSRTHHQEENSNDSISKINYMTSSKTHRVAPAFPLLHEFPCFGEERKKNS